MRTPDEIKKGLFCCWEDGCSECPYDDDCTMEANFEQLAKDALFYIQQLEVEKQEHKQLLDETLRTLEIATSRLAQVERERDAAEQLVHGLCLHCKNDRSEKCRKCLFWPTRVYFISTETYVDNWEWRGVCEENTKEANPNEPT